MPRIRFKTTKSAQGKRATVGLLFLTRVSKEAAVGLGLTGDQTRAPSLVTAFSRATERIHAIIEDFEDPYRCRRKSVDGSSIMSKLVDHLRNYLERDSGLRLVSDWARRPFQSHAPRLPVLHSQEFVVRLNLPSKLRNVLKKKMSQWPLQDFFENAGTLDLDFGKKHVCPPKTRCLESSDGSASILFKSRHDGYLKQFMNSCHWFPPESKLREYAMLGDCVVNDDCDQIDAFELSWHEIYHQVSVNTLTVTLSCRSTRDPPLHACNVCLPMVHPSVLGIRETDDWDKLLLLIAKLWQRQLKKSDEFRSFVRDHGEISWDVAHDKKTVLNVDGNPFALAQCNSDRFALVARWKDKSNGDQKEIVQMYLAVGLPHQHRKQFVLLAVCQGLFLASALVAAVRPWWSETLVLASTGDPQANLDLLTQWESRVPLERPRAGSAASRERWQETSVALTDLKNRSTITVEDLFRVLGL